MISNNQFLNNVAYAGGAIYVVGNSYGSVIIKNNVFDKCSAEFGGVISTENKVHVNIINNHFKNSFANYGAIVDYGEGSISFSKIQFQIVKHLNKEIIFTVLNIK